MFIDLHCHTLEVKEGDTGRNVDAATFKSQMANHNVKVVAITNHNKFDITQYNLFATDNPDILLLPGVELDVKGDKSGSMEKGHVIVISDNKNVNSFDSWVKSICTGNPNLFDIYIDDLISKIKLLDRCIVSFHYKKSPNLPIEDINYFTNNCDNCVVVLEPSNSRKAGIIINYENENSWFGSDNQDWVNYPGDKELPDCKFNIQSFDSLYNLLNKNQDSILLKTLMNPKGPSTFTVTPFVDLKLNVDLYNDVNVVFGSKATGKTEILKSIDDELVKSGKNVGRFYIEEKSDDLKDIASYVPSNKEQQMFDDYSCAFEISAISDWTWNTIPTLKQFLNYEKSIENNSMIKRLKITAASFSEPILEDALTSKCSNLVTVKEKLKSVYEMEKIGFTSEEEKKYNELTLKLIDNYIDDYIDELIKINSLKLEKYTIEYFSKEISKTQNVVSKPSSYGLSTVYSDRSIVTSYLTKINDSLNYEIKLAPRPIGQLQNKGMVYLCTSIGFKKQQESKHKELPKRKYINTKATVSLFESFSKRIKELLKNMNDISKFNSCLDELKLIINDGVSDLKFFLNYVNLFSCSNNNDFKPSNGEVSILMVDSVLHDKDLDAIILDEPDSGMGADYINDILIADIKKAAEQNKIILISTHDPNLVVRTHPYMCIFRDENNSIYKTYVGSAFEEKMINTNDDTDTVLWVEKCIKKCEGGNDAIIERERTYGHY